MTGSATGGMGAYLFHHGLLTEHDFVAEQGHWMGRPGRVEVHVEGTPQDVQWVSVAGHGGGGRPGHVRDARVSGRPLRNARVEP